MLDKSVDLASEIGWNILASWSVKHYRGVGWAAGEASSDCY